ncbi:MAG: PEGA domain-containing protein [Candidatus Omnitrophota bacterium]|nr:MAG: PEGA domain-containing protein [Candidatus Omnitrophota bacterium]
MNKKLIVLFGCLAILLQGCCSIVKGHFQDIQVNSNPSDAFVTVDGMQVKTPGILHLDTRKVAYVLKFEKEGYEPVEVRLKRGVSGWVFGNVIFGLLGGPVGVCIDFGSGAAYKLSPHDIEVALKAKGLAKKDIKENMMVFVDKEDLNEKIR